MSISLSQEEYKALVSAMSEQKRESGNGIYYQDSINVGSDSDVRCQITSYDKDHLGVYISFYN